MKSQFIISAPTSNAGKTTITLGLLRLLKEKKIATQPFKVGPDYIDPKFHELASGKPGVNLDLYMMDKDEIEHDLVHYGNDCQVNCIEGVMGLFDGAKRSERSTAELAVKTKTTVVFVVDAKAVAYSVAPLIQGFKNFDKNVKIVGVLFNRVGSERHYNFLKEACEDIGVPTFGYLKNMPDVEIPSRHLGLDIANIQQFDEAISRIASEMEKTVDWELLLQATTVENSIKKTKIPLVKKANYRFAVAKDEAFNFCYQQTIRTMGNMGEVTYFSPLNDDQLPKADFVYLPGGYPELYLEQLSANQSMRKSLKDYVDNNGKVFAECGGMMYLGKKIINKKQEVFDMVGVFDFSTSMENSKLNLGYRTYEDGERELKGHEFHYSSLKNNQQASLKSKLLNARGKEVDTPIFKKKNAMASYVHFYLGNQDSLLSLMKSLELHENIH